MTLTESFVIMSFTLFSIADLRYQLVPGIELFLFGAIVLAFPSTPTQTGIILSACVWGLIRNVSGWLALPLLFYPPTWPVLLMGYGYRKGIIGRADLLALCGLACLFPLPALLLSLFGLEVWRRLWVRNKTGFVPALPGMLLGILFYTALKIVLWQ